MQRILSLIVLLLSLAFAGSLPRDARFDQAVDLIAPNGIPLEDALRSAATSVGLTPLLRDIPATLVRVSLEKKPFRQVWDLLINTYGDGKLDYILLENNVMLVASPEVVSRYVPKTAQQPATPTEEPTVRRSYAINGNPTALKSFLEAEIPGIRVTVAPGQPTLLITATEKQHSEIAALLAQIDRPQAQVDRVTRNFKLAHARAEAMAEVLSSALEGKSNGQQAQGQAQPQAQPQAQGTAFFTADVRTNTLIVTASPEQMARVEALIRELDVPVKQVQLKVRIQSVDSSVVSSFGIKWESLSGGNLVGSIIDGALSLIFDASKSLAALNIRAVLDILEQQSLARRLSDVTQIVEDNYPNFEVKSGSRLIVTPQVQGEPTREFDVGLLVRVVPQITADGQITLEVFTQTGEQPKQGPIANSIEVVQRSDRTKLRIRDGQTVVIGGVVSQETKTEENKVPILGDIPILDLLFKQRETSVKNEELLIIITANIVSDTR
ncbi:putative type IV piliation system protein [Calidithermus terrae]|uniref:Putative type IV piliation system protein n=1 Tax=Calidithermus terrae TaxID=1408545 RepID=A0A399EWA3_9DEIN|nr:secretin N-terminal domain-containing protein [Calidithermus terrae]RIH87963.1 putative type IV piliation system protein [Calidithermus terrae]